MDKTYRQSGKYLAMLLVSDAILMMLFIGFLLALIHLIEYFGSSLTITKNGVILKKGILSSSTIDIPYSKINSITVKQGPLGRSVGYGDILLMTGNDVSGIPFKGIGDPELVKAIIQKQM